MMALGKNIVLIVISLSLSLSQAQSYHNSYVYRRVAPQYIKSSLNLLQARKNTAHEHGSFDQLNSQRLVMGREEMGRHQLIVAGITRNNGKDLPIMIEHIERTVQHFQDYRVVLYENDSEDESKSQLQAWQNANPRVKIISENVGKTKRYGGDGFGNDLMFLAKARNRYLDAISQNTEYNGFDMLMVVDMDMSYGWDMLGMYDSFAQINVWDAVCSNGIDTKAGHTYDTFAFRTEAFPEDYLHPDYYSTNVRTLRKIYPMGGPLISVYSCFGGLAFYKRKALEDCRYDDNRDDCEHVSLHECLREKNQGKIFLNPSQVIRYSHYH